MGHQRFNAMVIVKGTSFYKLSGLGMRLALGFNV